MLQPKHLARGKQAVTVDQLALQTGGYDHGTQRRWNGRDPQLIAFNMKSLTAFDGESKTNEADK